MAKTNNKISYPEVYKLIDGMRIEILNEVRGLREDFNTLERGRVSALETKIANIEGRLAVYAIVISTVISIAIALAGFLFKR